MDKSVICQVIVSLLIVFFVVFYASKPENRATFRIGEIELIVIRGDEKQASADVFAGSSENLSAAFPDKSYQECSNYFLIRIDGKNLLLGAGGIDSDIVGKLASIGFTPEKIDRVLVSNMQMEQIGGLVKDGKAVFPNAILDINELECRWVEGEYDFEYPLTDERKSLRDYQNKVLDAYRGSISRFPAAAPVVEGVIPMASFGHTPGHTMFLLESNEKRLLILGSSVRSLRQQIEFPEIYVSMGDGADLSPEISISSRLDLLEYVSGESIAVASEKAPFPCVGYIVRNNGKYEFHGMKSGETIK